MLLLLLVLLLLLWMLPGMVGVDRRSWRRLLGVLARRSVIARRIPLLVLLVLLHVRVSCQ